MRKDQFIVFLIFFTILYIIFFYFYDKIVEKKYNNLLLDKANNLIDMNIFFKFANFYEIKCNVSKELILKIFLDYYVDKNCIISLAASNYNLNNNEFVLIILYLEYLNLLPIKSISLTNNYMNKLSYNEEKLIVKYKEYFENKNSYNDIISFIGNNSCDELYIINLNYLFPGIRIIDSNIYYVGDYL